MIHHRSLYHLAFAALISAPARAHDPALSTSEISAEGTRVRARFELATGGAPLEELSSRIAEGTEITLGGAPCARSITGSGALDADGAFVELGLACERAGGALTIELRWLALGRHLAHLTLGEAALTAVLTSEHPRARLEPARPRAPALAPSVWPWLAGAAVTIVLVRLAMNVKRR